MIEVSRPKDLKAAELFLGFRIGAVGRRDFAVFPVQGHRGLRRLKRYFGNKMSVGAQMVVVLKAFVEHCVSLVLSHPFECSRFDVSQTDVFHCSSPRSSSLGGSQYGENVYRGPSLAAQVRSDAQHGANAACTLVIDDNDAFRGDCAFRHLECRWDRAIGKQSFSTAQRYRKYFQPERIDQIMLEECLNEICASINVQIRPFL